MAEDRKSRSLVILAQCTISVRSHVPLRDQRLHAEFAQCPEDQECVLDKQLVCRDGSTHGIQISLAFFSSSFGHLTLRHIVRVERLAIGDVYWDCRCGQLRLGGCV